MVNASNVSKTSGATGLDGGVGGGGGGGVDRVRSVGANDARSGSTGGSNRSSGSTLGAPSPADRKPSIAALWAVAVLSFAAVAFAVWAQHRFDWRPCPWCILQRVLFVGIGLVAVIAALWRSHSAVRALSVVGIAFSAAGVMSALWQHFVAAKSSSCMATFADQVITTLGLDSAWPSVFRVTGSCAEAAVSMLGVPFEFWSLGLFVVLGAVLAAAARTRLR